MLLSLRIKTLSILTVTLSLVALGCSEESSDPDPTTPEELLTDALDKVPQMGEALSRLVLTLQGNPQPGVNLTPITDGVEGTVGVDLDGNGSNETTVAGSLVYIDPNLGISGGATLTITGISGGGVDGTLTTTVTPISPTDVTINGGTGAFNTPAGDITVSGLGIGVGLGTPVPSFVGFAQFFLDGNVGEIIFDDDGQGGLEITLDYGGEVITVP